MAEKVCSVEGCATGAIARGLCRRHYQRRYRHGDPAATHARPGVELPRRDRATGRWVKGGGSVMRPPFGPRPNSFRYRASAELFIKQEVR
jgi:hypothetical protein